MPFLRAILIRFFIRFKGSSYARLDVRPDAPLLVPILLSTWRPSWCPIPDARSCCLPDDRPGASLDAPFLMPHLMPAPWFPRPEGQLVRSAPGGYWSLMRKWSKLSPQDLLRFWCESVGALKKYVFVDHIVMNLCVWRIQWSTSLRFNSSFYAP